MSAGLFWSTSVACVAHSSLESTSRSVLFGKEIFVVYSHNSKRHSLLWRQRCGPRSEATPAFPLKLSIDSTSQLPRNNSTLLLDSMLLRQQSRQCYKSAGRRKYYNDRQCNATVGQHFCALYWKILYYSLANFYLL